MITDDEFFEGIMELFLVATEPVSKTILRMYMHTTDEAIDEFLVRNCYRLEIISAREFKPTPYEVSNYLSTKRGQVMRLGMHYVPEIDP